VDVKKNPDGQFHKFGEETFGRKDILVPAEWTEKGVGKPLKIVFFRRLDEDKEKEYRQLIQNKGSDNLIFHIKGKGLYDPSISGLTATDLEIYTERERERA
jgi:hypothetical protein